MYAINTHSCSGRLHRWLSTLRPPRPHSLPTLSRTAGQQHSPTLLQVGLGLRLLLRDRSNALLEQGLSNSHCAQRPGRRFLRRRSATPDLSSGLEPRYSTAFRLAFTSRSPSNGDLPVPCAQPLNSRHGPLHTTQLQSCFTQHTLTLQQRLNNKASTLHTHTKSSSRLDSQAHPTNVRTLFLTAFCPTNRFTNSGLEGLKACNN